MIQRDVASAVEDCLATGGHDGGHVGDIAAGGNVQVAGHGDAFKGDVVEAAAQDEGVGVGDPGVSGIADDQPVEVVAGMIQRDVASAVEDCLAICSHNGGGVGDVAAGGDAQVAGHGDASGTAAENDGIDIQDINIVGSKHDQFIEVIVHVGQTNIVARAYIQGGNAIDIEYACTGQTTRRGNGKVACQIECRQVKVEIIGNIDILKRGSIHRIEDNVGDIVIGMVQNNGLTTVYVKGDSTVDIQAISSGILIIGNLSYFAARCDG